MLGLPRHPRLAGRSLPGGGVPQLAGRLDLAGIWTNQAAAGVAITVVTVVPYFIYLFVTEAKPPHVTWGKRRANLAVMDTTGGPPSPRGVLIRNLVKVAPWQLGHMGSLRLATSEVVSSLAVSCLRPDLTTQGRVGRISASLARRMSVSLCSQSSGGATADHAST